MRASRFSPFFRCHIKLSHRNLWHVQWTCMCIDEHVTNSRSGLTNNWQTTWSGKQTIHTQQAKQMSFDSFSVKWNPKRGGRGAEKRWKAGGKAGEKRRRRGKRCRAIQLSFHYLYCWLNFRLYSLSSIVKPLPLRSNREGRGPRTKDPGPRT